MSKQVARTGIWYRCLCERINFRRKYWLFGALLYDRVDNPDCRVHHPATHKQGENHAGNR